MREELKPYLDMANGLTEITRQRATEVAKALIAQGMALSAKGGVSDKDVRDVADEVLSSVKENREFLLERDPLWELGGERLEVSEAVACGVEMFTCFD